MRDRWCRFRLSCAATALALGLTIGCGGGGGGGGGTGAATVSGNLTSASTSAIQPEKRSWFARAGEELLGFARRVYAAVSDTSLGGVTVNVTGTGGSESTDTDDQGDFFVGNAPTGDVTVSFGRGNCKAQIALSDVTNGSTLDLNSIVLNCNQAAVGELDETFQGVLENKPASPNGNLNVCAFTGGANHIRAVKTRNGATFENPGGGSATFADLQEGDLIEVSGQRAGIGANSAVTASSVKIISSGQTGKCATLPSPTPTPEPTATPSPSPTP